MREKHFSISLVLHLRGLAKIPFLTHRQALFVLNKIMKTPIEELIEVYKERVDDYKDDARQEAIFYAVISDLENILEKEKQVISQAFLDGKKERDKPHKKQRTWLTYYKETFNKQDNDLNKANQQLKDQTELIENVKCLLRQLDDSIGDDFDTYYMDCVRDDINKLKK